MSTSCCCSSDGSCSVATPRRCSVSSTAAPLLNTDAHLYIHEAVNGSTLLFLALALINSLYERIKHLTEAPPPCLQFTSLVVQRLMMTLHSCSVTSHTLFHLLIPSDRSVLMIKGRFSPVAVWLHHFLFRSLTPLSISNIWKWAVNHFNTLMVQRRRDPSWIQSHICISELLQQRLLTSANTAGKKITSFHSTERKCQQTPPSSEIPSRIQLEEINSSGLKNVARGIWHLHDPLK